ncbi:hypothetical protein KKF55_03995 [Patescibacteria group bacterium]|nr:hypothetical protein [Patescibacteria group bacterium]
MKSFALSLVVGLLVVFCTQEAILAQKIHVLMVANTSKDNNIATYCQRDVDNARFVFAYLVPSEQYCFTVIQDKGATQSTIFAAIREHNVNRNDAFVFLFTGHGGNSNNHHFMQLPNRSSLWSYQLDDVVNSKRCNFRAIISSSCNAYVNWGRAACGKEEWNVKRDGIAPVMENLFFNHSGFLHMNDSWPGHYAWCCNNGSEIFDILFSFMCLSPNTRTCWCSIDKWLDGELDERFHDLVKRGIRTPAPGQTHARPITWNLPSHN